MRTIPCPLPLTSSMRLWTLFHTGPNIRRNIVGTSYVIDSHISLCVIRPIMPIVQEHAIGVHTNWLKDISRIPVRKRHEMQTGIETLTVEWRSAKTLGHSMYKTGPDRSKRRIGRTNTQCDDESPYILNSLCLYYKLHVLNTTFRFEKDLHLVVLMNEKW